MNCELIFSSQEACIYHLNLNWKAQPIQHNVSCQNLMSHSRIFQWLPESCWCAPTASDISSFMANNSAVVWAICLPNKKQMLDPLEKIYGGWKSPHHRKYLSAVSTYCLKSVELAKLAQSHLLFHVRFPTFRCIDGVWRFLHEGPYQLDFDVERVVKRQPVCGRTDIWNGERNQTFPWEHFQFVLMHNSFMGILDHSEMILKISLFCSTHFIKITL